MRIFKTLLILLLLLGALTGGFAYWQTAVHPFESTDNTYLKAHMSLIGPREPGYVKSVFFENNQSVNPGDLLVVIDDADFKAKVAEGEARIQVEKAQIQSLETDKRAQNSRVAQQDAEIAVAEADIERAAKDLRRFSHLVTEGAVSTQTRDAADAALKQARAQREKFRSARGERKASGRR
jgi:membrane fusion protein (multidrug efflux system)